MMSARLLAAPALMNRLAARAAILAAARSERRARRRLGDGSHWRRADLLWPLFTKER